MYRLILVRFDRDNGRFEDDEFNKFCAEQSIIRIEKEFINTGGEIYYSFFIEYVSRKVSRGKTSSFRHLKAGLDFKQQNSKKQEG